MTSTEKNTNHLAANKIARATAVDTKTRSLIGAGFSHSTKQFSLSLSAQSNWLGVKAVAAAAGLPYPYPVATLDNSYHLAADEAEMLVMADAAMLAKGTAVASGAALKKQIEDAADQDALDLVVDTR
jgi:hypothetical protein